MAKLKFNIGDKVKVVDKGHCLCGRTYKIIGYDKVWKSYLVEVGSNWHDKAPYSFETKQLDFTKRK